MWNFPRIGQFDFRHGVSVGRHDPRAVREGHGHRGRRSSYGTLIAASVPRVDASTPSYINSYNLVPFTGCLPVASKTLTALCVNPGGNLALRLSNPSDEALRRDMEGSRHGPDGDAPGPAAGETRPVLPGPGGHPGAPDPGDDRRGGPAARREHPHRRCAERRAPAAGASRSPRASRVQRRMARRGRSRSPDSASTARPRPKRAPSRPTGHSSSIRSPGPTSRASRSPARWSAGTSSRSVRPTRTGRRRRPTPGPCRSSTATRRASRSSTPTRRSRRPPTRDRHRDGDCRQRPRPPRRRRPPRHRSRRRLPTSSSPNSRRCRPELRGRSPARI